MYYLYNIPDINFSINRNSVLSFILLNIVSSSSALPNSSLIDKPAII